MDAQHTPGPWYVVDNGYFFEIVVAWKDEPRTVNQYSPKICSVSYENNDDIAGASNVNLIAAAPDMLEALHVAEESVGDLKSLEVVRAAIAKATAAAPVPNPKPAPEEASDTPAPEVGEQQ
jgi:hypothetical protein